VKRPVGPLFRRLSITAISAITLSFPVAAAPATQAVQTLGLQPLVSDAQWISSDANPPSDAACNAVGRRCFNPKAMANSYNYAGLHASGIDGRGKTIAIIDSFGASTIRQDLDRSFGSVGQLRFVGVAAVRHHPVPGRSGSDPAPAQQRHWPGSSQPVGSRGRS
jgi:subtilase family serine protease